MKLLLINLKRYGDVFSSIPLVEKIRKQQPNSQIDFLLYSQCRQVKNLFSKYGKHFFIDRKRFSALAKSNLYNRDILLNELDELYENLSKQKYDVVINSSNDKISTYITSVITVKTSAKPIGTYLSLNKTISYSSPAARTFNESFTDDPYFPFSYGEMQKLLFPKHSTVNFKNLFSTSPEKKELINKFFYKMKNKSPELKKIIALQVRTSSEKKSLPTTLVDSLLDEVKKFPSLQIVFLFSPGDGDLIEKYKSHNHIICKFEEIPEILNNVSHILTPDTAVKHLASLCSCKIVELFNDIKMLYQYHSNKDKSISIYTNRFENLNTEKVLQFMQNDDLKTLCSDHLATSGEYALFQTTTQYDFSNLTLLSTNNSSIRSFHESHKLSKQFHTIRLAKAEKGNIFYNDNTTQSVSSLHLKEITFFLKNLLFLLKIVTSKEEKRAAEVDTLLSSLCNTEQWSGFTKSISLCFSREVESILFSDKRERIKSLEKQIFEFKNILKTQTTTFDKSNYKVDQHSLSML